MSARRLDEACVACGHVGLGFRFRLEGERIHACEACRTHHVRPLPDAMRLHKYYDGEYALVERAGPRVAGQETRRDDARPLAIGLLRRVTSRLAVRRALTARFGTLQPDGGGSEAGRRSSSLHGGILSVEETVDRLGAPIGEWIARRGAAEELWIVARRKDAGR
jgi:hypothetical protein